MEFNIYDIYTDASIFAERSIGCAGMVLVNRKTDTILDERYLIKEDTTNNESEIIGIWMGIVKAISLLVTESIPFHVNLFSDSRINLFGMREWLPKWIEKREGNTLINTSGEVSNQIWFNNAFRMMMDSKIKIKFFHQKGHVSESSSLALFESDKMFRTSNHMSPNMAHVAISTLAKYNNLVDNKSREIVNQYAYGVWGWPNVQMAPIIPFETIYKDEDIYIYETLINGGLNYPINYIKEEV